MFERMRSELNHMEEELTRCKKLREQQETDFYHKLQDEKKRTERQLTELGMKHDQEMAQMKREHRIEVETVRKELERTRVRNIFCLY